MTETPSTYIGTYVDFAQQDSSDPSDYTWARFEGLQGKDGNDGIPGANGENGQTSYLHIKYSNNGGTSFTSNSGETPGSYIGQYVDFVQQDSSDPSDYTWSKIQGEDGLPGSDGRDGKTSYFHIKYSSVSNPTSSSQMTETPSTYIGTYVDFAQQDSSDPSDYTWARFEGLQGKDGNDGIPGANGENGQTSYLHIKYSNNGGTSFTSNSGETPGSYIGQYVDFVQQDSSDPSDYTWSKIQGETGPAARTYMIEPSVNILKRSKDDTISPNFVEFKSYYRDGNSATRTAYSGRWIIEETSDGDEWTTIYTSSANESSVTHYLYSMLADSDGSAIANSNGDTIGIPRDVVAIRAKLYASGGTTNLLDMQSIAVVVDVDALTHEEIFNLLTNNGEVKGIYQEGNQLYISFTYAKGGELTLGGSGNGNGKLKILNASGSQVGYIDNTGVHFNQGTFAGSLSAATGTFTGVLQAATGNFSGTITSSNANITGGNIFISSDESSYSIINLKSGQNFENNMTPAGITVRYSNNSSHISGSHVSVCNEDDTAYISPRAIYVSDDPTGLSPYNYENTIITKSAVQLYDSSTVLKTLINKENISSGGDIFAKGNMSCGGTKSRVVNTKNYSDRKLYCYEMPSPLFGDIGEGTIDQNGECYVFFDDIFSESVNPNMEYQVFLQKEGQGDLWVEEKTSQYFLVKGTENLKFAWEVKVKQKDYEYERLEAYRANPETEKLDYEAEGMKVVGLITQKYIENSEFNATNYYKELEEIFI